MKKIQRFMITSKAFDRNSYNQIFRIDDDNMIRRIEWHPVIDLAQPQDIEVCAQTLPPELAYIIIDLCIVDLIKGNSFEKAFQLISIDRSTITRFYRRWFGPEIRLGFRPHFFRLSRIFELLQKVLDSVLQFPNEEHDHYMALDIEFQNGFYKPHRPYYPWNFNGNISLIQIPRPGIFGVEDFRAFVTGPYVTDVVWMNGRYDKGAIYSDFFRLPVIVFVFTDHEGNIIPKREEMEKLAPFQGFATLLKLAFGPTTGIFFAVQGHYIFDDQILLEL
jgi:hypothetical protein